MRAGALSQAAGFNGMLDVILDPAKVDEDGAGCRRIQ